VLSGPCPQHDALLSLRLSASLIRRQAGGAADCPILPGQFVCQQFLSWGIGRDFLVSQEGEEPLLKGAETTFDLSFGLGAGGDQMGDAQRRERPLELRTRVTAIGGGLMAEERQAIGVEGQRQAVSGKSAPKVLEMVPRGVGRNKDSSNQLAGMIVDRQQEGLFVRGGPPLVD
jgi:hypothetical protein